LMTVQMSRSRTSLTSENTDQRVLTNISLTGYYLVAERHSSSGDVPEG
jgi:hypothetical protein